MLHEQIHITKHTPPLRGCLRFSAFLLTAGFPCCAVAAQKNRLLQQVTVSVWIILISALLLLCVFVLLRRLRQQLEHTSSALRKNKQRLKLMGDKLPNVTLFQISRSLNNTINFRYLSAGTEKSLNIDREQLLRDAAAALDYIYEADIGILKAAADAAATSLEPIDLEIRILDRSGNLRWLAISAVPCREKDGIAWDGLAKDISSSKTMEHALVEENHNFEQLFESIGDFLLVCDMNGKLLHTNSALQQQLGYTAEMLDNMSLFELYADSMRSQAFEVIAFMQTAGKSTNGLPLQNRNGENVPVEMCLFRGLWRNNSAIFCVGRDVARRKQTEIALRESQQMLQLIMDTIPMAVFWTDKDSVYIGCNSTFIQECGLGSAAAVIGKNPMDLFSPQRARELIHSDQLVIHSNKPSFNKMTSYTRTDGSLGWRETSKIPLQGEGGNAVGVLGVWRDVTEQHHAEERLKRTLEDMERFNQLMRGRERRTLQLKAEINDLLLELGRQIKYRTTTDGLK